MDLTNETQAENVFGPRRRREILEANRRYVKIRHVTPTFIRGIYALTAYSLPVPPNHHRQRHHWPVAAKRLLQVVARMLH